jgi:hypothetical protein
MDAPPSKSKPAISFRALLVGVASLFFEANAVLESPLHATSETSSSPYRIVSSTTLRFPVKNRQIRLAEMLFPSLWLWLTICFFCPLFETGDRRRIDGIAAAHF